MYYYYDILLNFGEDKNLFEFYEWENEDNIDFIKKIPLFRVTSSTLKDFLKYRIKMEQDFLELIKNKTILKTDSRPLEEVFLICDTKNALALELNKDGLVMSRSKLLPNDEMNLNEIMFTMKETKLKYSKQESYPKRNELRQITKIKNLIKCEIDTLYETKNSSKLKYLYYECFDKINDDLNVITKEMKQILQGTYNEKIEKIYELIKMSYHNKV